MLPLNVRCGDVHMLYSTAEIAEIRPDAIRLRLMQTEDVIAIETGRQIAPSAEYHVEQRGTTTLIVSTRPACLDDRLTISF